MAWANTGIDRKSLDPILRGRLQCFSPVEAKGVFEELDSWMRAN